MWRDTVATWIRALNPKTCQQLENVSFCISSLLLCLMLHLVFTQSQKLHAYRFYLLNNIMWAYVLQALLFVARPRFLFPRLLVYFDGPLRDCPAPVVALVVALIQLSTVNVICGILMTLGFRYGQLLPMSVTTFVKRRRLFWPCVIAEHVVGYAGIALPIMAVTCDPQKVHLAMLERVPLEPGFSAPTIPRVDSLFTLEASYFRFTLHLMYGVVGFFVVVMVAVYCHMKLLLNSATNRVFYFTYQLQSMLVSAYAAETLVTLLFLLFPVLGALVLVTLRDPLSGRACQLLLGLASFYPVLLFLTIAYFIRPYRVYIKESVGVWVRRLPRPVRACLSAGVVDCQEEGEPGLNGIVLTSVHRKPSCISVCSPKAQDFVDLEPPEA